MKKKLIFILICFIWIGCIFYNSSKNTTVSNNKSYMIADKVEVILNKVFKKNVPEQKLNVAIRKCAHMFEYAVLSILMCILISILGLNKNDYTIYVLFLCLLIADFDEFYQSFVPGRTSHVSDVFIDFAGALVGMLFYAFFSYKNNTKSHKKQVED